MATVLIKAIGEQHMLSTEDFEWIKSNINKPLPLSGLEYARDGSLLYITIYKDESIMILWVRDNNITFSLRDIRGHAVRSKKG